MMYENQIGLFYNSDDAKKGAAYTTPIDPAYK